MQETQVLSAVQKRYYEQYTMPCTSTVSVVVCRAEKLAVIFICSNSREIASEFQLFKQVAAIGMSPDLNVDAQKPP